MSECALLHPEGFCVFEGDCSYRNEDRTCSVTENDLITITEFMEVRGFRGKVNE